MYNVICGEIFYRNSQKYLLKEILNMALTNNPNVLKWVDEMIALTKPDKVVWIDGSKAQLDELTNEALSTGEMQKLNEEKLPGCLYARRKTPATSTTGWIPRKCTQCLPPCTTA